jgi:hypothetical protein
MAGRNQGGRLFDIPHWDDPADMPDRGVQTFGDLRQFHVVF